MRLFFFFCVAASILLVSAAVFAKSSVVISPSGAFTVSAASAQDIADSFDDRIDVNGPHLAEASLLSGIACYPIGDGYIKTFPHFEAGAGISTGFSNMKYFDDKAEQGALPAMALTPVYHFGTGLSDDLDFIGKITYFDIFYYNPSSISAISKYLEIKELKTFGLGGKVRYHLVRDKRIIPFFLSLDAINLSFGGDFQRGIISMQRDVDGTLGTFTINYSGTDYDVPVDYAGTLDGSVSWFQVDGIMQLTAHFNLLSIFNFYTGFGCALGYSWFKIEADADSDITAGAAVGPISAGDSIGTATFTSENVYRPFPVVPTYIFGAEISVLMIKFTAETMVNLQNREDVTLLVGLRIQI